MTKKDQNLENENEEIIDAASEEETVDEMKMKHGKDYKKKMKYGKKDMKYEETEDEAKELEEMLPQGAALRIVW